MTRRAARTPAPLLALALALGSLALAWPASSRPARRPAARAASHAPALGSEAEPLGPPRFAPRDGAIHWGRGEAPAPDPSERRLLDDLRASRGSGDSLAAWLAAAGRDAVLAPFARLEAARISLAQRDSALADSLLARVTASAGPWRWTARRQRVQLALARGGAAAAASVLGAAPTVDLTSAEADEWVELRLDLLLGLGDTTEAIGLARERVASPPPWIAARMERRLEAVLAARGEPPTWSDEVAAARVDAARGERSAALVRLERASRGAPAEERWRPLAESGRLLDAERRFVLAREALSRAESLAADSAAKAEVLLARARVEMDAKEWPEAERLLAAGLASWPAAGDRGPALISYAMVLEAQGEWARAAEAYGEAWRQDLERAGDAAFRAGLMALAAGEADSALSWFGRSPEPRCRFWKGVLLRRRHAGLGDTLLMTIASQPGYGFYQVAARETLGVPGWPRVVTASPAADSTGLRLASLLLALGRGAEARGVVQRWLAWNLRPPPVADGGGGYPFVRQVLHGATLAYSSKWEAYAISLSETALRLAAESCDSPAWSVVPWLYPPAFERAFAALPQSPAGEGIDRSLMRAVARRESHFDSRARSRSDALGLLQLKLGTAADEARRRHERRPRERDLFDPGRSVRLGSAYLARLLARFGSVPRALAAYNAGPTTLTRWLERWETAPGRDLGGLALECELVCRPETITYVKEILAARQAYRELRPTTAP